MFPLQKRNWILSIHYWNTGKCLKKQQCFAKVKCATLRLLWYINSGGAEVILQFAVENSWISDISFSIYEDKPSHTYIETLEDCELLLFSPETKEELFAKAPRFERAFRILLYRNLAVTQERLFNTIAKTAMDKYLEFLQHYPTLPQRVAQHYIASYLGISAEFLSKVRAKIAKH